MEHECTTPTWFCTTPTTDEKFTFTQQAPNVERSMDFHNLMVKKIIVRTFTPLRVIHSPGLSPICKESKDCSPVTSMMTAQEFKVPTHIAKKNRQPSPHVMTPIVRKYGEEISVLDTSKSSGYLNHTLNVYLILKNAGLEQYNDAFEREGIDFGKFLTMKSEDLNRLGFHSAEHQKIILDLLKDLNASA